MGCGNSQSNKSNESLAAAANVVPGMDSLLDENDIDHKNSISFNHDSLIFPDAKPPRIAIAPYNELQSAFLNAPLLGEGGFGVVYQAKFRGEDVAVKKLNMSDNNTVVGDFIREVTVLGTLAHPNIVRLVGVSCDATNRCLLYELCAGGNLADLIALSNESPSDQHHFHFGWPDRLTTALDTCLGLACLHECTLVHCDIKPQVTLYPVIPSRTLSYLLVPSCTLPCPPIPSRTLPYPPILSDILTYLPIPCHTISPFSHSPRPSEYSYSIKWTSGTC